MALILGIETSSEFCSVALYEDDHLIDEAQSQEPQSHASLLAVLIDALCRKSGRDMSEISAIAVSAGPGSFTGLRIGVSTAKALGFALNKPLISVGTLELLAKQMLEAGHVGVILCPMLDARRMEVYCMVQIDDEVLEPVHARVIESKSFSELLENQVVLFFGNGSRKCRDVITHKNAIFLDDVRPMASTLAAMAAKKFRNQEFEDLVAFEPFYLKEFTINKKV